jgi:hypothetical protein
MPKWTIIVGGYGAFLFDGTEQEAEEMRAHKARWERGIGRKRLATDEEVAANKPSQCWNHEGFANRHVYSDCDCDDMDCIVNAHERLESLLSAASGEKGVG